MNEFLNKVVFFCKILIISWSGSCLILKPCILKTTNQFLSLIELIFVLAQGYYQCLVRKCYWWH